MASKAGWGVVWLSKGVCCCSNVCPIVILHEVHGHVEVLDVAVEVANNEMRHATEERDPVMDGFEDIIGGLGFGFGLMARRITIDAKQRDRKPSFAASKCYV